MPGAFHPLVARWFTDRFGEPTPPQERGWAAIREGRDTLIAAPTGSGKTLAAFLTAIDELMQEAEDGVLPDEIRVVYVSPLKALSADIHHNLAGPRREIHALAERLGVPAPRITAAVRTGDTTPAERQAMLRRPPHILVTTPESLYLLLTARRSREMLRTVRTVIVDEIHSVVESRRGAHLSLTLERLEHVAKHRPQRIGLSATQRPIETVARFLVGTKGASDAEGETRAAPLPAIVDEGHARELDIALELLPTPLEAVMSGDGWEEVYDRIGALVREHRTTLVFVNTRRLAERVTLHLRERLGEDAVQAHHGSLSKERREQAERRLKEGSVRVLVATASLELGIDVGHIDLVCQIGSPRRVSTFLQRVGRSGHTVHSTPKGRLFPLNRDELVESAALLRLVRREELDRLVARPFPLDVLAQQITAEVAAEEWSEDALFEMIRRAWLYRALERPVFDDTVAMLARGFTTRRGRRGALVHRDAVNRKLRGRRGSRMLAITAGGAIPENGDYRVLLEPGGTFIGTVNEDFAVESMAGDIFQLGNASWQVLKTEPGVMRVADAHGQPPSIPFWLGEAPARSDEVSAAVAGLRAEVDRRLESGDASAARQWLADEIGLPEAAAFQIVHYLEDARRSLGVLPTQETLVLERFFDESGGMQLILHAPFGGRVNRAWGLALRKKFCRSFNFELQAAATEEGVLLSLGPQHSFPLEDVFRYLHPETVRDTLIQAVLDAPLFHTRWRWVTNLSLAVPRWRGGRKVPPPLQRMMAEDLLAAAFPDAAACLENVAGERAVPDHPLVTQAVRDCLEEAMDLPQLEALLRRITRGELRLVSRDLPEPSALSHQILNARVYEFLDDAPLEERRAQAVYTRRALEPSNAQELGALDFEAIERVRAEAWPRIESADELHEALELAGFLTGAEQTAAEAEDGEIDRWFAQLAKEGRIRRYDPIGGSIVAAGKRPVRDGVYLAAERTSEFESGDWTEVLRGRLDILGPVTTPLLGRPLGLEPSTTEQALLALEAEGTVLRGHFTPGTDRREWCDRRLLARIHRYTLNRLRAAIEPVDAAAFQRFLARWQHVEPEERMRGPEGLLAVLEQLDGYELPAAAWEADVLPARMVDYAPEHLDALCSSGRIVWTRLSPSSSNGKRHAAAGPLRTSPIALCLRESADTWLRLTSSSGADADFHPSAQARQVLDALEQRGALFFPELASAAGLLPTQAEQALAELSAAGRVTADGYSGLRALLTPAGKRPPVGGARRRRGGMVPWSVETAGRWSLVRRDGKSDESDAERSARALLRRYGVVFRRLLTREPAAPPWRTLVLAFRRLELRGEIRGGRFVAGMTGEQFALPEAVGMLRAARKPPSEAGEAVGVSAADPLNLVGIITPGVRVPAVATNRLALRHGVPVAALEAGEVRPLADGADGDPAVASALARSRTPRALRAYLPRTRRVREGTSEMTS